VILGIVGGGQLARMLAMAAARLEIATIILDPAVDAPAAQMTNDHIVAAYSDVEALAELAGRCDIVTYEFENVPTAGLEALNAQGKLRPGPTALAISQDRLDEKQFIESLGLRTAPYQPADSGTEVTAAAETLMGQASGVIVKTRRLGYDGKGQVRLAPDTIAQAAQVPSDLGNVPLIVEGFVDFEYEISVIGARDIDGSVAFFDPARNTHENGILARSVVPSGASNATIAAAQDACRLVLDGLDYVGVLGVEFFVLPDGTLIVNEFAPRVHNSGHCTEAACLCSQFEQHVRAVTGLPLGDPARHSDAEMVNLLGDTTEQAAALTGSGDWMLHLYGKSEARPGRKMGHATRLT